MIFNFTLKTCRKSRKRPWREERRTCYSTSGKVCRPRITCRRWTRPRCRTPKISRTRLKLISKSIAASCNHQISLLEKRKSSSCAYMKCSILLLIREFPIFSMLLSKKSKVVTTERDSNKCDLSDDISENRYYLSIS